MKALSDGLEANGRLAEIARLKGESLTFADRQMIGLVRDRARSAGWSVEEIKQIEERGAAEARARYKDPLGGLA